MTQLSPIVFIVYHFLVFCFQYVCSSWWRWISWDSVYLVLQFFPVFLIIRIFSSLHLIGLILNLKSVSLLFIGFDLITLFSLSCLVLGFIKFGFNIHANSSIQSLSVQFSSVTQSCLTLCDLMNCSMPGLPVHHQLPEFTQTHVHWVSDAIQPSHPLSSPSPPAPDTSQNQGLFQWVNSAWGGQSTGVSASASVLPMNTQDWSPLKWTGWTSLQSKRLSRVFSNTAVQKHQFFGTQLSSQSKSHIHTWPLEKP